MPFVQLFTDGSCYPNPGPGGWAFVLRHPSSGKEIERSGSSCATTNNRMELQAVIAGLMALTRPSEVEITTDSQYVISVCRSSQAGKTRKKNTDLCKRLIPLLAIHKCRFVWVRGHEGHTENERCDVLAGVARRLVTNGR